MLDEKFEKGFQATLDYKEATGDPNAPQGYKTQEGYRLGSWQSNQREDYKKGKLSHERIQRLEGIGFKWIMGALKPNRLKWDHWYELTLEYMNKHRDPNAPQGYKTQEGYRLGSWQINQRKDYKNGKITLERVERLESIGFSWGLRDKWFEKGFQETLNYKKDTGDPNAPKYYKTPEGYKLGRWQGTQRYIYWKGKLSTQRIERLEKIGFRFGKPL